MSEVELGRLKIIKRRAWNKERCVCQWLTLCGRARARADERNGATADRTSCPETFKRPKPNISEPMCRIGLARTAPPASRRPHLTQGPVPQRAGDTLQMEDRAFVKSR